MATGVVDIFMVSQFLKRLATPFEKWDAFKEGIIDKEGNILKKKHQRGTLPEKAAFKIFDLMILKLKKLLGKVPLGKTKLASYAAALWLIKENWEDKTEEQSSQMKGQYYSVTSILFADFVGFTNLVENSDPGELLETLNTFFSGFDRIISKHNVLKVKTVGDCYM